MALGWGVLLGYYVFCNWVITCLLFGLLRVLCLCVVVVLVGGVFPLITRLRVVVCLITRLCNFWGVIIGLLRVFVGLYRVSVGYYVFFSIGSPIGLLRDWVITCFLSPCMVTLCS